MTKQVKIGNKVIGGGSPVLVQSMLNVISTDIEGNVAQAKRIEAAGCDIVRVSVPDLEAVKRIASGHQAMSAYKDYNAVLQNCLDAVEAVLTLTPLQNGNVGCYNGAKFVSAQLTLPVTVDAQNCREVLVDGGIIAAEDIQ
jgi:(E)-4-hydroxy-3-methylbut-2-enyl-diphosphate synthase